jgi:hypothetical protein
MRAASTIYVGTFSLALAACGGESATGPADGGTVDGTLDDSAVPLDSSSLDANDGSLADATQDSATLDDDGASSDSSLTVEDSGAPDASDEDAATYAGPVVHIVGTAVESPSAAPLTGVTICAYAQPAIPCVTTPSTGAFDVMVPASAETGVTLAVSGRESVLLPLETTTQNQVGWEIGMTATSDVEVIFSALGATYPDSTTGFLGTFASPPGGQIGVAGVTMAVVPQSGKGPIYLTAAGAPDPSATATSTYSAGFFGNLTPGDVTVTYAPASVSSTLACSLYFGGWVSALPNSVRVPIAAGFDTHVGMACTLTTEDAGGADDAGAPGNDAGDASLDARGD